MVYKGPLGPQRFWFFLLAVILTGLFANESLHWPDGLGLSKAVIIEIVFNNFCQKHFNQSLLLHKQAAQ